MTQYERYDAGANGSGPDPATDPPLTDEAPWQVLVEYSNRGEAKPPTVVEVLRRPHPTRETALQAAQRCAFEFQLPDPFSPQGRQVFRDGPDAFIAIIERAMSTFHMSVRIVQHVGDA